MNANNKYKFVVDLTREKLTKAWMQSFNMWKGEPSEKDNIINGQNYIDNKYFVGNSTLSPPV